MGIRLILMWTMGLIACGSDSEANQPDSGADSCPTAEGTITLHVASSVPEVLGSACVHGDTLDVFLVVPGNDSCSLEIEGSMVVGCCGGVSKGQNPYIDLYFREAATQQALGMQSKVVYLPVDSAPIVELNFDATPFDGSSYDSDNDGTSNVDEFCNGTL